MTTISKTGQTLTVGFIGEGSGVLLEVINETQQTLNCVEILTVFLKDEDTPGGGPSRVHISFDALESIRSHEKTTLSHKTWIDGKRAVPSKDQLERLKVLAGEPTPYALEMSWQDVEGKTRYQRVPVGH